MRTPSALIVNGEEVEGVSSLKSLGTLIPDDLKWDATTTAVVKKAHQHLSFLRTLLSLLYREHFDGLNHNMVCQLHRHWQEIPQTSHKNC